MGMVVQHNMNAINAYNRLNANVAGLKKASEKLASGYRINRAGDDAAGLAISEKMRSQIKGLNQAVRNSQDGINMIQTYEGAAQETHSILQRMKELAVESANGTYDNATDRAAIQLEFDQLNDELNQIADTDFNGTVVLNGGVMADGTVAQNGEFRYANGVTETVLAQKATDISADQEHTLVDQSTYDKVKADAVWDAVGVDVADKQTLNVTFMFDGERWVADTVTDTDGNIVDGARASGLEARPVDRTDASGKGGFEVIAGKDPMTGEDIVVTNAIFDEMKNGGVKKGDTVTIQFENSAQKTYAPKNVGLDEDYDGTKKAFSIANEDKISQADMVGKVSFKLDDGITDDAMSADMQTALKALDDAEFKFTYTDGVAGAITDEAANSKIQVDTDGVVTYEDGDVNITLGKFTVGTIDAPGTPATTKDTFTAGAITNDDASGAGGTLAVADANAFSTAFAAAGLADGAVTGVVSGAGVNMKLTLTDANGKTVDIKAGDAATWGLTANLGGLAATDNVSFTVTKATTNVPAVPPAPKTGATSDIEFGVNVDAYNYAEMKDLSVHSVATPKAATMAAQVAEAGVSKADSFGNSTGVLTYTDNLTLQTGARTKDSVNFSFSYNQDGTADMGSLVANLDLSSRSTGLNTASLSLADQKSANYAIDQIDKAINKTSMVRATFGSIQNRLEHKITNLTTTSENLTEAESSIRDTDMASEMMNYTKFNILQQAAQSMLAQANQQPQSILQLLG